MHRVRYKKNVILLNFKHNESIDILDVLRFLHKDFTATAFCTDNFVSRWPIFQPWLLGLRHWISLGPQIPQLKMSATTWPQRNHFTDSSVPT